jgi:hypothetical protein
LTRAAHLLRQNLEDIAQLEVRVPPWSHAKISAILGDFFTLGDVFTSSDFLPLGDYLLRAVFRQFFAIAKLFLGTGWKRWDQGRPSKEEGQFFTPGDLLLRQFSLFL